MPYKDKEQAKRQARKRYLANRDTILAKCRSYQLEHKEQRDQANARYRQKHRAKIRSRYRRRHRKKSLARRKARYAAGREEMRRRQKEDYRKNRERILRGMRAARRANPAHYSRQRRKRRRKNLQRERAKDRARYRKNPLRYKINAQLRRARLLKATIGDTKAIAAFYLHVKTAPVVHCAYCGRRAGKGRRHVDHRIPLTRGGAHCVTNLEAACARCNLSKNNRTPEEFRRLLLLPAGGRT